MSGSACAAGYVLWSLTLQLIILIEYWCCSSPAVLMMFRMLWTSYAFMLVPALVLTRAGDSEMEPGCGVLTAAHVAYTIYAAYMDPLSTTDHLVVTVAFTAVVGIVLLFVDYINRPPRDKALPL